MLFLFFILTDPVYRERFMYLYDEFYDDSLRYATYLLEERGANKADALDIVQSAYGRIGKYIASANFDTSRDELHGYVKKIVSNEISRHCNKLKPYEPLSNYENVISDEDFIAQFNDEADVTMLRRFIRRMPPPYVDVISYRFEDNLTPEQIAKKLKIPRSTVYTRLNRGMLILQEMIDKEGLKK